MSRSIKAPLASLPYARDGKIMTSRKLRRKLRHAIQACVDFFHVQDCNRGFAGSKEPDCGWNFFSDRNGRKIRDLSPLGTCK